MSVRQLTRNHRAVSVLQPNSLLAQRSLATTFLFAILLIGLAGCKKTHSEIVQPYLGDYQEARKRLTEIAALLPQPRTVVDSEPAKLDPPFEMLKDVSTDNAEGLMFEELVDPNSDPPFDLHLSETLGTGLHWTSDERRDDDYSGGNPVFMRTTLDAGLDLKYLVVHRAIDYQRPQAIDDEHFTGGSVTLEGFVIDLTKKKIVGTYVVTAQTDAEVSFSHREDESAASRAEAFAHSTMFMSALKQIEERLRTVTGGKVEIR